MPTIRYYTQKNAPGVMLPSRGGHVVDAHGSIRRVTKKTSKKERRMAREKAGSK